MMLRYILPFITIMHVVSFGYNDSKTNQISPKSNTKNLNSDSKQDVNSNQGNNPFSDFVPTGYVIFEKILGDLNKDNIEDCVLIIKDTDKSKVVKDEYRGELDRNRRGIVILFAKNGHYELVATNSNCFSSENEDGGVYYAPELSVTIKKGNLYIGYEHGRYGSWTYKFRFNTNNFDLIGYDVYEFAFGLVLNRKVSINFLTKRKLEKVNVNDSAESGEEVFKKTWKTINIKQLIKLSEIRDFDELDMDY